MKKGFIVLLVVLLGISSIAVSISLYSFHAENEKAESDFSILRQKVLSPSAIVGSENEGPDIRSLKDQNRDCIGWITIPGTEIDYPVMQSVQEPEFYLKHNFEGDKSSHGVPFLDARCNLNSSDNLILYGHQMQDETMFSSLLNYENQEFLQEHPTVEFFTMEGKQVYRIFAVLRSTGTVRPESGWSIFNSIDLTSSGFEDLITNCQERSIVSSNEDPESYTRLLTLVTCEYSQNNGRLAVVCYRKE